MSEHPILFSAPMVRAILEGRKTQTRRVVRWPFEGQPQAEELDNLGDMQSLWVRGKAVRCPYGVPGDHLWVRETWSHDGPDIETVRSRLDDMLPGGDTYGPYYRATEIAPETLRWIPAIHMPRWACRLKVEVTDMRVERLTAISDMDAMREGVEQLGDNDGAFRAAYRLLWDSLNAKRGFGWAVNPWVWVVEFKQATPSTRNDHG